MSGQKGNCSIFITWRNENLQKTFSPTKNIVLMTPMVWFTRNQGLDDLCPRVNKNIQQQHWSICFVYSCIQELNNIQAYTSPIITPSSSIYKILTLPITNPCVTQSQYLHFSHINYNYVSSSKIIIQTVSKLMYLEKK